MKQAEILLSQLNPAFAGCPSPTATRERPGVAPGPGIRNINGDGEWEGKLEKLNTYFESHREDFIDDLNVHYGVPGHSVAYLLDDFRMPPADVYLAIRIHRVTGRPIALIVNAWQTHIGNGWGAVTETLGILPDSEEYEALKCDDRGRFYAKAATTGSCELRVVSGENRPSS